MESYGNPQHPIPERIALLRPDASDPSKDQLFLDGVPVPRAAWSFDSHDRKLIWNGPYGGGSIRLSHDGQSGAGNVGPAINPCSVLLTVTLRFMCDVALNVGAHYVTRGTTVVGIDWNPMSTDWLGATWVSDRLLLEYMVNSGSSIDPGGITFQFTDLETGALPWIPVYGTYAAKVGFEMRGADQVQALSFDCPVTDPDEGTTKPTGPDSVYPYMLRAVKDLFGTNINGVMVVDRNPPFGVMVGFAGIREKSEAIGYYLVDGARSPFGVFGGRMTVGDETIDSSVRGDVLRWRGLSAAAQARTGLPETGSLDFSSDGGRLTGSGLEADRLDTDGTLDALIADRELGPGRAKLADLHRMAAFEALPIGSLQAMTPFVQNEYGAWSDVVQAAVTKSLNDIMSSCIPTDLWKLLFPKEDQPLLTGELAIVANSPVPGVEDPKAWYATLATAVFSQGMANGTDKNTQYLNGPRAGAWLKSEMGTSKVYYAHSQLLFKYEWQRQNPLITQYLQDQFDNAAAHDAEIDTTLAAQIEDIEVTVAVDAGSPPTLKDDLKNLVREAAQYAKTNKLYWAYTYYLYNTSPGALGDLVFETSPGGASGDNTTLIRLFQRSVAVLTALDPSGFFARQYTETINTFLTTNIVPSMYGCEEGGADFDLIKEYLQTFVANNLTNTNEKIVQAARQIQEILDDEKADEILHDSLKAIQEIGNFVQTNLRLPTVIAEFVNRFKLNWPKFSVAAESFGSALMGGVTGLALMNIITEFKRWSDLDAHERAQLINLTVQFGLQLVASVVQRGVRVYAMFGVEGMTKLQRSAAICRIVVTGEAARLGEGVTKIGNTWARMIAETEGSAGKLAAGAGEAAALLATDAVVPAEQATFAQKIFGPNTRTTIAAGVGALFVMAGIGFSIWAIIDGEGGVMLANDIVNIVGGALSFLAIAGEWLVVTKIAADAGMVAAMTAVAGPLAIVAALAGLGLMLYMIFRKEPDPLEIFVEDYAKPQFYVPAARSSIDYAVPYANPDLNDQMMIGFTLSLPLTAFGSSALLVAGNGTVSIGTPHPLPGCVMQSTTDGVGMSQIFTVVQPDPNAAPVRLLLSCLSDGTVAFCPAMPSTNASADAADDTPTIRTQFWVSEATGPATLTSDEKFLSAVALQFQPVLPDSGGAFHPAGASGFLAWKNNALVIDPYQGTALLLTMSGVAPNLLTMTDMKFLENMIPSGTQQFGPSFGLLPSTPLEFTVSPALPNFLQLEPTAGVITPNGNVADPEMDATYTLTAKSSLGSASAPFRISVVQPSTTAFA
jgi:hypothetical protein